jgi:hypothetical protein
MPDQAIVIIHGMGEQRPMDFLRGFVDAAIPAGEKVFSQPDPLSKSFELRRLRVLASKTRRPTFLYEYYWAHHMKGSTFRHLRPLIRRVFWHPPWKITGSLQFIYWVTWLLFLYLLFRFAGFAANRLDDSANVFADFVGDFGLGPVGLWIALVVLGFLQTFAVNYFGDVARYLDPKPENVDIRQTIRAEGLALLQKVNKEHGRVIIVAHSLGSIIALDLLGHLWSREYFHSVSTKAPMGQPALERVEDLGPHLRENLATLDDFRAAQFDLWKEQIAAGSPWKISDLITVGSPLAHARFLLASKKLGAVELQALRELPRCPPGLDTVGVYSYLPSPTTSRRRLHHAAHFAFTRWTNLWFPSRCGVFGDWFAGPVAPIFGPGVKDVAVTNGWKGFVPVGAHTSYFNGSTAGTPRPTTAIGALRAALNL